MAAAHLCFCASKDGAHAKKNGARVAMAFGCCPARARCALQVAVLCRSLLHPSMQHHDSVTGSLSADSLFLAPTKANELH